MYGARRYVICAFFPIFTIFRTILLAAAPIRVVFSQFRLQSVAPLTLYIRRSMTPLFPGSKQLATSHLRVVTFIIVMCRAETSTDPMFGLYDLKNAGPPTYASYRSPRYAAIFLFLYFPLL
jgi:hypothetical protein